MKTPALVGPRSPQTAPALQAASGLASPDPSRGEEQSAGTVPRPRSAPPGGGDSAWDGPAHCRHPFTALIARDLRLAARRRVEALLPVAFFTVAASLFPLGVGPEPQVLRQIAPGVVWVCALLASMLSMTQMYAQDHADGSLEQLLLSGMPPLLVALAKAIAHWLVTGVPLLVAAPIFGLLFDMSPPSIAALLISLALGTPILSFLGGVGAALTLGLRSGGVLLILLILPLCIPALIFGAGAVGAIESGLSARGHYSLLGALLIATALLAPLATAAALRISTE